MTKMTKIENDKNRMTKIAGGKVLGGLNWVIWTKNGDGLQKGYAQSAKKSSYCKRNDI